MFIIAILPKFGAMLLLIKVLNLFYFVFIKLDFFFKICALVSIIFGSLSALYQVRLKRFLAYSSISNFGYIALTLSVWPGVVSYVISLQYLFIYIVLLMGLFGLLLNLKYVRNYFNVNTFEELGSLVYTRKPLA